MSNWLTRDQILLHLFYSTSPDNPFQSLLLRLAFESKAHTHTHIPHNQTSKVCQKSWNQVQQQNHRPKQNQNDDGGGGDLPKSVAHFKFIWTRCSPDALYGGDSSHTHTHTPSQTFTIHCMCDQFFNLFFLFRFCLIFKFDAISYWILFSTKSTNSVRLITTTYRPYTIHTHTHTDLQKQSSNAHLNSRLRSWSNRIYLQTEAD